MQRVRRRRQSDRLLSRQRAGQRAGDCGRSFWRMTNWLWYEMRDKRTDRWKRPFNAIGPSNETTEELSMRRRKGSCRKTRRVAPLWERIHLGNCATTITIDSASGQLEVRSWSSSMFEAHTAFPLLDVVVVEPHRQLPAVPSVAVANGAGSYSRFDSWLFPCFRWDGYRWRWSHSCGWLVIMFYRQQIARNACVV